MVRLRDCRGCQVSTERHTLSWPNFLVFGGIGLCCVVGWVAAGGKCCPHGAVNAQGQCCPAGEVNTEGICCRPGNVNCGGVCCSGVCRAFPYPLDEVLNATATVPSKRDYIPPQVRERDTAVPEFCIHLPGGEIWCPPPRYVCEP